VSSGSMESSRDLLARLHRIIAACGECDLAATRTRTVPGEGDPDADVMFIGEGPGAHEDAQGRPFCGPAGALLDELLASIDLPRDAVFITNTVKCRPPGNRTPLPTEVDACAGYLRHQVRIVAPKVVATLGGPALRALTGGTHPMASVHGMPVQRRYFTLLPLYHPAAALHKGDLRPALFEDFRRLRECLEGLR